MTSPQEGSDVTGTAMVTHSGSYHGKVCPGATEDVQEGALHSFAGCDAVQIRQLSNYEGKAKFEFSIGHATKEVKSIGFTVMFSNKPTDLPKVVS